MGGRTEELSERHDVVERQTSRGGGAAWRGLVFCSCGWVGGVFDYPKRDMTEIALDATWLSHAREARSSGGSGTDAESRVPLIGN